MTSDPPPGPGVEIRVASESGEVSFALRAAQAGAAVAVVQHGEKTWMVDRATPDDGAAWMCDVMGVSTLSRARLVLEVPTEEALTLGTVLDGFRAHLVAAGSRDAAAAPWPGMTATDVQATIDSSTRTGGALDLLRFQTGTDRATERCEALVGHGVLRRSGDRYVLDGDTARLATGLRVLHQLAEVTYVGRDGALAGVACAQFGPHDLLWVEATDGSVHLEALSTAAAITRIRDLLILAVADGSPDSEQTTVLRS